MGCNVRHNNKSTKKNKVRIEPEGQAHIQASFNNIIISITNNKGQVIQFGSIGGGGRYDNLVNNFGNYDAPATGISIGLDRLVYALMQKKEFKVKQSKPVVCLLYTSPSPRD